jgi:hypothetical protein
MQSMPIKLLYIDALNFGNFFFDKASYNWSLYPPKQKIKAFIRALNKQGIKSKIFIDESVESEEAIQKWKTRREKEIIQEKKGVPQGMSTFLGDIFRKEGIPVLYSLDADNDDTLAAYAQVDGADVLSGDGDFYRYRERTYRIFSDFDRIKFEATGQLDFIENTTAKVERIMNDKKDIMRDLIIPLPKCVDEKITIPCVTILQQFKLFRRGVPSPLIKELGFNPHITIKPLRRAIYNHIFKDEKNEDISKDKTNEITIKEEFPYWSTEENKVVWTNENVTLYKENDKEYIKMMKLLKQTPDKALQFFFPNECKGIPINGIKPKNWRKHCFACKSIICELYCMYNGKTLLSYFI